MKSITLALSALLLAGAPIAQQPAPAGPAGIWEIDDTPWTFELQVSDGVVTGKVSQGAQESAIFDGTVSGESVSFKVKSPDGDRTITLACRLREDVLTCARSVEIVEGGAQGGTALLGGTAGPDQVVARRASGERWTGSVRNAPTRRNPNPNPQVRPVMVGTRKMADPHWRWRGGEKEMTIRTFTLANQSFPLNTFGLSGDTLSMSYSRPGPGDEVKCELARQPEGLFRGMCEAGNGNFTVFIELTPPAR